MKENLVQKLDLLEAQLASIEERTEDSSRLNRTKHLLERLQKSGNARPDREQLERDIAATKREIVDRKRFHAVQLVKRALKQFMKVEPLRIAKRQKSQAENAAKLAVLDAELELVQTLDAEKWAEGIVARFMARRFALEAERKQLAPAEINVLARIGKTDPVKKALSQLEEGVQAYIQVNDHTENTHPNAIRSKEKEAKPEKGKSAESDKGKSSDTQTKEDGNVDDFTEFDDEGDRSVVNSDDSSDEGAVSDDDGNAGLLEMDPFFNGEVGLPQLTQGFISGSDSEEEDIEPEKPQRKNRRGQRARRKIWEQKFGHRANHVIKQEKQEREEKEQKAAKRRAKDEKYAAVKRQKAEFAAKPVHPSWAAQQKLKEQQKTAKFEGKKMTFD